ncbi:glycosyl transferase [Vibrio sp. MMG022]|uniref:glycosyl transferase n=1 Tax=Vibrio sp. MMG023 TaxID=2909979 RepID=UPI001F18606C|nr:glycosyl transferase [Vibrio sp. MMG023]MCF6453903.1 glycosyl transferase [Vibrio sp. MMG023]
MGSSFNPIEKKIAVFLRKYPFAKNFAKSIYSRLMYLVHKKNSPIISNFEVHCIEKSDYETFFGYYDKCPDNGNGLILVHLSKGDTSKKPRKFTEVELNVYDLNTQSFILEHPIQTSAFNWQQGSRAHWVNESTFIYNDYVDGKYKAIEYSLIDKKRVNIYDFPVQDSYKEEYFLSLNYEILSVLRPDYGYFSHGDSINEDRGIYQCNIGTDTTSSIVSLEKVLSYEFPEPKGSYEHKLNHIMISPDGSKFIFMHRYYNESKQRFDRLLLADRNGNLLKVLSKGDMVSHCYWTNNDEVLGYLTGPGGVDKYWKINIHTGNYSSFDEFNNVLSADGHPSVSINGEYLTDTYPDKSRMQSLYYLNDSMEKAENIASLYHSFKFSGETRCDLHPRFSSDAKYVFFDTVFNNKRKLAFIKLDKS